MPRYPALSRTAHGLSAGVYTSLLEVARQSGAELFPLNVGDTYLPPPACARCDGLRTEDLPGLHNYAPVQGEPALLRAIARDLEARARPVPISRIQVTAGATSGLDLICRSLLAAGDEVIVLAPYWPLIRGIVCAAGAVPVELPFFTQLREPDFDLERALAQAVSPRTTAIYVNSPHNPTGVVLAPHEIDALARFAARHDLWVISDEAYERLRFVRDQAPAVWLHPLLAPRSVVAHTLSKSHGLAGARVGFVHGPEAAMPAIRDLQTYATYCAARPMQQLAAQALASPEGEAWIRQARQRYHDAARKTTALLALPCPESGTFVLFDTRPYLRAGEHPMDLMVRAARAGVVLTPGAATGQAFAGHARLCFTSVAPDTLDRALAALHAVLYDGPG